MQIVPVTPEHVPVLSKLAAETFSETFAYLYPPEDLEAFLAKSYAPKALMKEITQPDQFWRIVFDDQGTAVAYLQCGPVGLPHPDAKPDSQGELKRIYIHSSQQGKGLGKALMKVAMDYMTEHYGDAPQWIGVWSGNSKAQALYGTHGFERVGEYQFPVGKTLDDEFILKRVP